MYSRRQTINKETYIEIPRFFQDVVGKICPENWARNIWSLLHDNDLYIGRWQSKITFPSKMRWLWSIRHILRNCHRATFSVSATRKCSKRTGIREHQGNHRKSDDNTERDIEKLFIGMLSKALRTLANA
jgi:hypothetical protein